MAQPTPNTKAQHELAHTLRPRAHEMPRLATMPVPRPMAQPSTPEPPRPLSDEPGAEHLSAGSSAEQLSADPVVEPSGAELSIDLSRALSCRAPSQSLSHGETSCRALSCRTLRQSLSHQALH
jgi:hypothetical protein